jgi:hypothetical protein
VLKTTIERRRKRLAERRRMGVRNQNAFDQELKANTRPAAESARSTTNFTSIGGFNQTNGSFIWGTDFPRFERGDPFRANERLSGSESSSFKSCFT